MIVLAAGGFVQCCVGQSEVPGSARAWGRAATDDGEVTIEELVL